MNSFDFIAPYYDRLAKLVFGRSLWESQRIHIPLIPQRARVLILGGGTGQSAWEIAQAKPDAEILFVEESEQMIQLAHKRFASSDQQNITFINVPYQEFKPTSAFDVIVAQCFFDVFSRTQLLQASRYAHRWLDEGGHLLVSDFQIGGHPVALIWQRALVQIMQAFFRIYASMEATQLEDINGALQQAGFNPSHEEFFYGNFIFSRIYIKDPSSVEPSS